MAFFYNYFQKQANADVLQMQVLLEILQYSQESIRVGVFLIKSLFNNYFYFNLAPKETSTQVIPVEIAKFLQLFLWNTSGDYFCQLVKVTV